MNNPQYAVKAARKYSPIEKAAQEALKKKFDALVAEHLVPAFDQLRTANKVTDLLASMLIMSHGRRTIANALIAQERDQEDWNATYRAFSVGKWNPVDLFEGVFKAAMPLLAHEGPVILGIDDTGLPRTGDNLENAGWIHNPLVPKYVKPAIQWGIPMLHAALLIPSDLVHRALGITVAFEPIAREKSARKSGQKAKPKGSPKAGGGTGTPVSSETASASTPQKKRGRPTKAETEQKKSERAAIIKGTAQAEATGAVTSVKLKATEQALQVIHRIRGWMDLAGMKERVLLVVGDGSYTNGTVMGDLLPHHTEYAGRTRPDTKLQGMGTKTRGGKIQYGQDLPTPKELAENRQLQVNVGKFDYAGSRRDLKFLAMGPVFRKTSTKKRLLRLMILEPVPYGRGKGKPKGYNLRAYLLTTDMTMPPEMIVMAYLMRWELEVLHRIYKTDLGVGTAQVRKHKLPAAMVAYYALLQIAIRLTQGQERHAGYGPLPKWRAMHRAWFTREQVKDGKPAPRFRPSPTDIKTITIRALVPKGTRIHPLVA